MKAACWPDLSIRAATWSSLKHPAEIQTVLAHVYDDPFTTQAGVNLLDAIPAVCWVNRCNCSKARRLWPTVAEPKGQLSVKHRNCCRLLKADTNQLMQHVGEGDFCYGPAWTREKTLFQSVWLDCSSPWFSKEPVRLMGANHFIKPPIPQIQLLSGKHWLIFSPGINGWQASTDPDAELYLCA